MTVMYYTDSISPLLNLSIKVKDFVCVYVFLHRVRVT